MKTKNILISFCLILFMMHSCSRDDSGIEEVNLDNFKVSPELSTLSFKNEFDFGYNQKSKMNVLLKEYTNYLFMEQEPNDEPLLGFEIEISANKTIIVPINALQSTEFNKSVAASCPEGYTSLGTCYSALYVEGKISAYFADNEDEFENGAIISFQLVSHMGGKSVCAMISSQ